MGHILEHHPGNIAQMLGRGATTSRAFWFDSSQPQQTDARAEDPWAGGNDPWSRAGADNNTATYWQRDDSGSSAGPWCSNVFWADGEDENGTDSDTASSDGNTAYPIPDGCSTAGEIAQKLFWNYQRAKGAWRQWTGKPVRAVRRFIRGKAASKGQHKGKGRGKGSGAFLAALSDDECEVFFGKSKGKGKSFKGKDGKGGKGKRTSGKGFGRKRNPIGPDGTPMACHECGSEYHFADKCPNNHQNQHQQTHFVDASSSSGPLAGLVDQNVLQVPTFLMMTSEPQWTTQNWDTIFAICEDGVGRSP